MTFLPNVIFSSMNKSMLTVIFILAIMCCKSLAFLPLPFPNSVTLSSTSSVLRIHLLQTQKSSTQLELFQSLFGGNKNKKQTDSNSITAPSAGKASDVNKLKEMKSNLAKIENTQKRDYEAEAKARAPPPKVLQDKQTLSFNFNKPNEFPNLFKGKQFIFI